MRFARSLLIARLESAMRFARLLLIALLEMDRMVLKVFQQAWSMGLLVDDDWQARWIGFANKEEDGICIPSLPDGILKRINRGDGWGPRAYDSLSDATAELLKIANNEEGLVRRHYPRDKNVAEILHEKKLAIPRYLRKQFIVTGKIMRATAYATALGLYELRINGERVGDCLLAPEWTNYNKRVQYQTYDVTEMLCSGENAIGVVLGNGWYSGLWQFWPPIPHLYGDQPKMLLQLEIEYDDGERQVVSSDDTWAGTATGPLRFSGIYEGETYDARHVMDGWDRPGNIGSRWDPCFVASPKVGKLVWQRSEPIRVTGTLKPQSVAEPKPGTYVFDFGQNMVGWCRMKVKGCAGAEIAFRHNEMLNPDGTVYMENLHAGHLSTGDRQVVRYVCRGDMEETYEPRFTYMGFRYVEVTGLSEKPPIDMLLGMVFHTGFREVGSFACSNQFINRLVENIKWSQRGNMMGIPTDCPQRDERCGYTGDGQFFMPTAVYNMDMAAFNNKWLVDICQDSQRKEGYFCDHAPDYGQGASNVGWQEAGVICPYIQYRTYGDVRVILENYAAMKRFVEYLDSTANTDNTRGPDCVGNGDWLNLGGDAPKEVIGTAYYAYVHQIMGEMASVIGQDDDAEYFHERARIVKQAFIDYFISKDGKMKDSSQTGYALAFTMGLIPDDRKDQLAENFINEIARFDWSLATGFIGTPRLLPALHIAQRDDVAYRLLLKETFPSWLYPVTLGATTIWERWDGWTPENGFQDSGMNSFNHYAFGSVGQYLFGVIGGIQPDEPGYSKILIEPAILTGLKWAKTSYESICGQIATEWKWEGDSIELDVGIPANTTATIHFPTDDEQNIFESGVLAKNSDHVHFLYSECGRSVFRVGSGSYRFCIRRKS